MRDPLPLNATNNFSADHRTRIILLAGNIQQGDVISAQAEDAQHQIYPLSIEFMDQVPGYNWLTQIVVKFPNSVMTTGDFLVSISRGGVASNKATVTIKP
jgi:hypothetical protein